ncbi:MAG TPA: hypothetical protein VN672_10060 [Solirubrobacteraceae bacterium]|nr:hypothetical protein [Solirubrobacteraceae bacterium]
MSAAAPTSPDRGSSPAATQPTLASTSGDHQILGLILLFTAAIFAVVGAVWALAAVGGWWMLAVAFAVHLLASALVLAEVFAVMTDQSLSHEAITRITSWRRAHRKTAAA